MTHPIAPSHSPYGTVCHFVVQHYFQGWLINRRRLGKRVPKYVRKAFRKFLKCGDPNHGFSVLECPDKHHKRYVAYRCKGRGFCSYCLLIRQRTLGEHLIERVLGNVPVRHWILCFPPALRYIIGYDKALLSGVFAALANAVFNHQRRRAVELFDVPVERVHPGCAEVAHRASANLDTNHHVHGIFPEGVFIELEDGTLEFHRLPAPSQEERAAIVQDACLIFCARLKRCGFWETTSTTSDTVTGMLSLPNASGRRTKFFSQVARDGEGGIAPRDGAYAFHLLLGNAIEVEERPQLQALVDYILAPPFLDGQVSLGSNGNVVVELKRARHNGTTKVIYEPFKFLDRLAELIPRPRANTIRYFGIYAPRSKLRKQAIAVRVADPGPARRILDLRNYCPTCGKRLVPEGRRRTTAVPPDTPGTPTPRGQDRIEGLHREGVQGRLFDEEIIYTD
jgi:hypothetical protein